MYKIEFSHNAVKEFQRVYQHDKRLYARFCAAIDSLAKDPFQGKKLKEPLSEDYSVRLGDYRIVYTVLKDKLLVHIIDLGHRRAIYR